MSDRRFWAERAEGAEGGNGAPAPDPETPKYPTYVEQLRGELAEKDRQLREYIAAYKEQVVRGIDDTKERLQRENQRELERLRGRLVEQLLEVLDNLDRSLEAGAGGASDARALVDGVRLVRNQFEAKLSGLGLARLDAAGQPFDPALHEAIGIHPVADPAQDGRVVRVIKQGYKLGDRVLRPAVVQVGKLAV
ncbi:MAG TPA: nucleotide exchange factor GrpE [Polyangia bacterium]|nr:nucleotide exchange factor GrpE [Polyangia bacterium]